MTPQALRKLALSFPGAHEEPHFERGSFRVGKKIFATLSRDGREAMVKVSDAGEREVLLATQPEAFFRHGAWTARLGAVGVRLTRVDAARMRRLLEGSWRSVAPRSAVAELEGRGRRERKPRGG
jgi:hypothetical protein